MDIRAYNRQAWNHQVEEGNRWTVPVSPEVIAAARRGEWAILLTPTKATPRDWFPADLAGVKVLCLAGAGGQQAPVLAAAGANVTVLDNSPRQLERDQHVAEREGLILRLVEGDMADLSAFPDASFDLIFHPVSNVFVPDVHPVWAGAYRILCPGGALLAGFMNPVHYIFDLDAMDEQGRLEVRYSIPYSDLTSLEEDRRQKLLEKGWPLEFGHSLEDQLGGQLKAGFLLAGFYEDHDPEMLLSQYIPTFIASRAIKPQT
jgi:SAM-dependent methyltransferase